ncbi:glycoside hydrolase family 3 protein [Suillus subaureus]|uniref:beta-glucosidase n=1 Tax=Suillus subaureus TaxID=48587 RepID=A0A9P7E0S1_9AGAM|nr:glycoside hydrolase family 3 protein [Suillus subaureus]KAG1807782.1 glycoside hydrolase family 3 protein [Suillus subaureus]
MFPFGLVAGLSSATPNSTTPFSFSPPTIISSGVITVPLSSYSFTPYPTPTLTPSQLGFPAADPLNPPNVSSDRQVVLDFAPAWTTAYQKARNLISNYTIEEKVNITTGVGFGVGLCSANIAPNKNFPGLCLQDSPLAVRGADFTTVFPAGIQVASTWNRALMRARGLALGQEFKGKGVNIALAPMMNMGRVAQGGRNWEGFGADPFLVGESAYETVLGLQHGGVQSCAKHFINNEQEQFRAVESSNVDDRTQHEIYAHPFLRSVMAGLSSVMCSFNLINDTYACNNDKMLNDILKREYGFQGFVMSDSFATTTTLSAVAGLDMTIPGNLYDSNASYFGGNLTDYVNEGYISMARLDDMATRIIAAWYFLHQDEEYPATNFNSYDQNDEVNNKHVNVQADHYRIVREIGAAGTVLLKNTNGALPLNKPKNMVLIGSDAGPGKSGPNEFLFGGGVDGILAEGWGSGTGTFSYVISPLEGIQERARQDGSSVSWDFDDWNTDLAGTMAIGQAVALVFTVSDSGEGIMTVDGNPGDRNNLTAWNNGDDLVLAVAAQNNNTIVVVNSVGPLIVEPWIEHPNITAVVWAGIQGQEAGSAIADVLYGAYNPSGRLPYTIAKDPADYPAQLVTNGSGSEVMTINYTEGLFIDYRHFDQANITPRFEFGFGLSYTTFSYSNLGVAAIQSSNTDQEDLIIAWEGGEASPIAEGSSVALWLHEPAFQVTFMVTNTGSVSGTEIPQLYIHHPSSACGPPSVLKGFTNVEIGPYDTKPVSIILSRYDLSIWDAVAQGWRKPDGQISFSVGASSRDFRLWGVIPA